MTAALFLLAAVCAVNAPRALGAVRPGGRFDDVPGTGVQYGPGSGGPGRALAGLGTALAFLVLAAVAALSGPVLDLLDISAPTARIAVGVLLVVEAVVMFGWRTVEPEPALPGQWAALVPVAFPTLLTPGLVLLTLSGAADLGVAVGGVGAALALATLPLAALAPPAPRLQGGLAMLLNGVLVLCGFGLLFDGVFDI